MPIKLIKKKKKKKRLLRIFHALQTSCVLHISMNARLRVNQLLINAKITKHYVKVINVAAN